MIIIMYFLSILLFYYDLPFAPIFVHLTCLISSVTVILSTRFVFKQNKPTADAKTDLRTTPHTDLRTDLRAVSDLRLVSLPDKKSSPLGQGKKNKTFHLPPEEKDL